MDNFITKMKPGDIGTVFEFCREEEDIVFIGHMYSKATGKAYRKAILPIVKINDNYYLAYLLHSGSLTHIDFWKIEDFDPENYITDDEIEIKLILRTKQERILYGFLNENLQDAKDLVSIWIQEEKSFDVFTEDGFIKPEEFMEK